MDTISSDPCGPETLLQKAAQRTPSASLTGMNASFDYSTEAGEADVRPVFVLGEPARRINPYVLHHA